MWGRRRRRGEEVGDAERRCRAYLGREGALASSIAPPGYHFLPQPCMLFSFHCPLKMLRRGGAKGELLRKGGSMCLSSRCKSAKTLARLPLLHL